MVKRIIRFCFIIAFLLIAAYSRISYAAHSIPAPYIYAIGNLTKSEINTSKQKISCLVMHCYGGTYALASMAASSNHLGTIIVAPFNRYWAKERIFQKLEQEETSNQINCATELKRFYDISVAPIKIISANQHIAHDASGNYSTNQQIIQQTVSKEEHIHISVREQCAKWHDQSTQLQQCFAQQYMIGIAQLRACYPWFKEEFDYQYKSILADVFKVLGNPSIEELLAFNASAIYIDMEQPTCDEINAEINNVLRALIMRINHELLSIKKKQDCY
jgi:hypothetical protein